MPVDSLWPRLEPLLPKVRKPVQYVGGELNAQVKDWDSALVRWCLMYPDAYEVGLPNQGLMILYEVLNEQPDVLAERTYSVWSDSSSSSCVKTRSASSPSRVIVPWGRSTSSA